jgi:hypothetical protein
MHVHLPKPLHGWREFLGEVGIIVLGVLIALGAEQLVEMLHWRQQAREAESALHVEIQDSVSAVGERFAVDSCLRSQLTHLRSAIANGGNSGFVPPAEPGRVIGDLYATPWRAWPRGTWESATRSNVLGQLPTERLFAYAQIYKAIEDMDGIVRRERDSKGGLAPLALGKLTSEQSSAALVTLNNLDRDRADMLVAGRDLLNSAAPLGIRPESSASHSPARFKARYGVCSNDGVHK